MNTNDLSVKVRHCLSELLRIGVSSLRDFYAVRNTSVDVTEPWPSASHLSNGISLWMIGLGCVAGIAGDGDCPGPSGKCGMAIELVCFLILEVRCSRGQRWLDECVYSETIES